jgi:hypothetical protein
MRIFQPIISGSLNVSGSVTATSFTGSLFGTSSWASNATTASYLTGVVASASYAFTASYVNGNVAYIGGALYQTKTTSIGTGTNTIFTFSTGTTSFTSAFVDYYISDGINARSGQIQVAYLASQVVFNETATMDIGNTDNFVWNVVMSAADLNVNSVVASGTWDIKLIVRTI